MCCRLFALYGREITSLITVDVAQVVEAAVLLVTGYFVGAWRIKRSWREANQRTALKAKDPLACEGCGHHFSFHGKQGCNYTWYNSNTDSEWVCDCVVFVGMEPAAIGMVSLVPDQDSHNRVKQIEKSKKKKDGAQ